MSFVIRSDETVRTMDIQHRCLDREHTRSTIMVSRGDGQADITSQHWGKYCSECGEKLPQTPEEVTS